jgi:hypothetical protein
VVKTRLQSSNSGFAGMPPAGRPSNSSESVLSTNQKSSSFSVRRLVIPPEVATERPFQTTMPTGGKQSVVYNKNSPSPRWLDNRFVTDGGKKSYNSFDSSMRVAARFYSSTHKGLTPHQQQPPNLNVFQCLR